MDQHRFDALTRLIATPKTRRGLLGGLAALLVGAGGAGQASAQPGCPAGTDPCPGGGCADKKRDPLNCGRCGNACPADAACVKGQCRCPAIGCTTTTTTAAPTCSSGLAEGAQCAPGKVCLDGFCQGNGACATGGPCQAFIPGCGGPECGGAGGNGCTQTNEGGTVCIGDFFPSELVACSGSSTCPDGYVCADSCSFSLCYPLCGNPNQATGSAGITLTAASARSTDERFTQQP